MGSRLLICRIAESAKRKIESIELSRPLSYGRKRIKEILRVSCPEESRESIRFFDAVAAYLKDEIPL